MEKMQGHSKHTKQIPDYLLDKEIYLKLVSHIISFSLFFSIIDNIIRGHYFLLAIDIYCILSVNFGIFVLFRKYHYYVAGRLLLLSSGVLGASAASLITGAKYHNEHYLLVIIALSFLIFHQSERKWSFISATIAGILYFILIQFPNPSLPFDQGNWTEASAMLNQFSYLLFFILTLMGLSKSYDKAIGLFSLEAKLVEASKMASLGRMAGALAHEISNPISVIKLQMSLLIRKAKGNPLTFDEIKQAETKISGVLDRIEQITHGLRIVARDQRFSKRTTRSMESILSETLPLCQERIKQLGISFEFLKQQNEHLIHVNSAEISQVVINLLNNAIDAVETLSEKKITIQLSSESNTAFVTVTDSGELDSLIADKIMEPFYTTKAVGKGTGLGLTISQSIIENHNGRLFLNRESQKTQFVVQLPLVKIQEGATL
ncbi:MAG: ATP-binding protein [Bdellovibrionota bacterium]